MNIQSVRVRNFKAIVDSGVVKLTPLTVFIGYNGAGKSSLIEALETYQAIVRDGLDLAMQRWLGIEHACHKGSEAAGRRSAVVRPISFDLAIGPSPRKVVRVNMTIGSESSGNEIAIEEEYLVFPDRATVSRDPHGAAQVDGSGQSMLNARSRDSAMIAPHVLEWQFVTLSADRMGNPIPQQRTAGGVRLARDGSNIADFLLDLRRQDQNAFDGIVETMAYVLPYAKDIAPSLTTSEIERKAWLQLTESDFKVPGWMLSAGTLRLLALLALLRHPKPPPLILIEEIENGLDPRSMHLIVDEIRNAVLEGVTQVILTTHSPYLLDLLTLEHLVLVERDRDGAPRFRRPADDDVLATWANNFSPGKLYTMGNLSRSGA